MRNAARVDANQAEIVADLRKIGATVQPLHAVGKGCPDLLIGYQGLNYLMEIKDGKKPPNKQALRAEQVKWHEAWRGQVTVAKSTAEAMEAIGANIKGKTQ